MMLRLTCSTLAVMAMTAPAAFSLSADEVWKNWTDYLTASGYEIAIGNREGGGDALVLRDVVLRMATDETSTVTVTLPVIRMGQTGGGDVRTEYSEPATFEFTGRADDDDMRVTGSVDLTRLETITREEGGHQVDTTTAPEAVIVLDALNVDGKSLGDAPMTLTMRDMTTTNTFLGSLNTLSDARIGSLTAVLDFADPEGEAAVKGQVDLTGLAFATETNFPAGTTSSTPADLNAALRAGATLSGKGGFATLAMALDVTGDDSGEMQDLRLAIDSGGASGAFGLEDGRLLYQADLTDVDYEMESDQFPFPIQATLAAISTDLQFPLLATEAAQPFKFGYSLNDLVLNEGLWALIDQQSVLPHEPASLDIDLTGDILVHEDLVTYSEKEPGEAPPITPVALTMNQLALSALKASAAVDGAVSFPQPGNLALAVGTLNARLDGVNGLLDTLSKAGFLGPDELQGARMMMMMFAKPVDGQPDALQSTLELHEDGSVFANGMQLK